MSGRASLSTTVLAVTSASLLYFMSVCHLTLPMWGRSCFESPVLNSWSNSWSKALCRWLLWDVGSIVYFLIVLIQNELSMGILR